MNLKVLKKSALPVLAVGFLVATPLVASAETTVSTSPTAVLNDFYTGTAKMDDIAGMGAAMGEASCIFGAAAIVFKRFVYG